MADSSTDADAIAKLASALAPDENPLRLRIAMITAVDSAPGGKVQTSETGTGWVPRSEDTSLRVGDRVWLLQYSAVWIVGGRLSGESSANPIGAIMPFAGVAAPAGWAICDGSAISRTTYAALFALTGTGYGAGNGTTTFNLPDLRGKFPLGVSGSHAQTSTGGAETVALSTANLPAHDHSAAGNHAHGLTGIGGVFVTAGGAVAALASTAATWVTDAGGTHTHSSVGSGTAHENMPPFLSLPYIIRIL